MTTREALLQSILDNPAEDTPRLVYADLLDEEGEHERAEFIRVQIRRATFRCERNRHPSPCKSRGPGAAGGPHRLCQIIDARLEELLPWVARSIMGKSLDWHTHCQVINVDSFQCDSAVGNKNPQSDSITLTTSRGFVSHITIGFPDLLKHAGELWSAHPIERVTARGARPLTESNRWYWIAAETPRDESHPAVVPKEILIHLGRDYHGGLDKMYPTLYWSYPTESAALDALSQACIAYGRSAAVLPPLVAQAKHGGMVTDDE